MRGLSMIAMTALRVGVTAGAVMAAAVAPAGAQEAAAGSADLKVTLERLGNFYYAGDPVRVRVGVFNIGDAPYDNSAGLDLLGGILVGDRAGATEIERVASPVAAPRYQPGVIAPGGFFGFIADLRDVIPAIGKPGRYSARVRLPVAESDPIPIVVIPRFDPSTKYRAFVETDYGTIAFDLMGAEAPKHVQNFYDLANQGFYDGSYVVSVVKEMHFVAGDPAGDGTGGPGYDLPLEINPDLKIGRGTLSMIRRQDTDHGSQFLVSFGENSQLDGSLSVFGVMAQGEEVLEAIENLPTTGAREAPFYKPIRETRIQSVRVEPAPGESRATAP